MPAVYALPNPTKVDRRVAPLVERSDVRRGILHSYREEEYFTPEIFRVTIASRTGAARIGTMEHYYANFRLPWSFKSPGDSSTTLVMYTRPPSLSRDTSGRWTATLELERVQQ